MTGQSERPYENRLDPTAATSTNNDNNTAIINNNSNHDVNLKKGPDAVIMSEHKLSTSADNAYSAMDVEMKEASAAERPESRISEEIPMKETVIDDMTVGKLPQSSTDGDLMHTDIRVVPPEPGHGLDNGQNATTSPKSSSAAGTVAMLPYVRLKTGLVYDVRMRSHAKIVANSNDYTDPHPEDPRRIYRIYKALVEAGLVSDPTMSGRSHIGELMELIPIREVTREEVTLIHDPKHWDFMAASPFWTRDRYLHETDHGDSVYFNTESFYSAKLSCGGAIEACMAVADRRVKNALAVVRPPGHHAEPEKPGGFCLFSNVAVAASVVMKTHPDVKKVLIVDWDVHHGNGTQKCFYNDSRVLYVSLHRYDDGNFYPSGGAGAMENCGEGPGVGRNVNIPWPCGGMQDGDYIYAFQQVIMPIANEFDPDFVIISSGFDAAKGDPIGQCFVSPFCYAHMTHMLKSLANGKLTVVLEGGYNLDSISISALAVAKVLLGEPPGPLESKYAQPKAVDTIYKVRKVQSKYWECMKPGMSSLQVAQVMKYKRLHDVIRSYQSKMLYDLYGFTILPIFRQRISESFVDQVIVSPTLSRAETIVCFIHDTPEIWGQIDPNSGAMDPSESFLLDGLHRYINWGFRKGFAIIDANVPTYLTGIDDPTYNTAQAAQELAIYLWDNYLEISTATSIILFGVGNASAGIPYLLSHRDCRDQVKAAISIIGNKLLKPVQTLLDEYIVDWYFRNSLVITSPEHTIWQPKKPRKKYGRVEKSNNTEVNVILEDLFQDICDFMDESLSVEA